MTATGTVIAELRFALRLVKYWCMLSDENENRPCHLYVIYNDLTGVPYFGITWNLEERWGEHLERAFGTPKQRRPYKLYNALRKYGIEAFTFLLAETCPTRTLAKVAEVAAIASYGGPDGCYNHTAGGDGFIGLGEESRKRISEAKKGKGHPHTEESIEKIRQAHIGRKFTPEHVANMAAARMGKPSKTKGRKASPEAVANITAAQQRRRQRELEQGVDRSHSEETKRKMSASGKGSRTREQSADIARRGWITRKQNQCQGQLTEQTESGTIKASD